MSTTPFSRIRAILPLLWGVALCLPGALGGAQSSVPAVPSAATPDDRALPSSPTINQPPLAQPSEDEQTSHPQSAKSGPRVAMIDFESTTLPLDQIKAISQALFARLDAMPGVVMLPRGATRRWLIRHDLFPFTPYMRPAPAVRVTDAIKADYLITGHLDKLDGVFNLDVSVFSNRGNRYIVKDAKLQKDDLDALLLCLSDLNRKLYQAIEEDDAGLPVSPVAVDAKSEKKPAPEPVKSKAGASKSGATKKGVRKTVRTTEPEAKSETPRPRSTGPAESDERPFRPGAEKSAKAVKTPAPPEAHETPRPVVTPAATPRVTPAPTATVRPRPTTTPAATATPQPPAATANLGRARELFVEAMKPGVAPAERLQKLAEAATLAPAIPTYQQQLALEYYNQGNYEKCITQCETAIQSMGEGNADQASMFWTIRGSALIETGQLDQAVKAHEKALQVDPKNFWASYNLALALTMAKSERAAAAWNNFLTMAENDPNQADLVQRARSFLAGLNAPAAAPGRGAEGEAPKNAGPTHPAPTATPAPTPAAKGGRKGKTE